MMGKVIRLNVGGKNEFHISNRIVAEAKAEDEKAGRKSIDEDEVKPLTEDELNALTEDLDSPEVIKQALGLRTAEHRALDMAKEGGSVD